MRVRTHGRLCTHVRRAGLRQPRSALSGVFGAAKTGDRVEVFLDVDQEERAEPLPTELEEVLRTASLLDEFANLAPSCRRAWTEHALGAKRPETRVRRAAAAVEAVRERRYP